MYIIYVRIWRSRVVCWLACVSSVICWLTDMDVSIAKRARLQQLQNLPPFPVHLLVRDEQAEAVDCSIMVRDIIDQVKTEFDGLDPAPPQRIVHAMRIIGMYLADTLQWDAKSDYLLARLVGMFSLDRLRHHADAAFFKKQGAWQRASYLQADICFDIEQALARARYLLYHLGNAQVTRAWKDVFDFVKVMPEWATAASIEPSDLWPNHWTGSLAGVLHNIPWRLVRAGIPKLEICTRRCE